MGKRESGKKVVKLGRTLWHHLYISLCMYHCHMGKGDTFKSPIILYTKVRCELHI